jgi:hypothetical protein
MNDEPNRTVRATLTIEVLVECPQCHETIDLLTDTGLNDEGHVLRDVISDDAWKKAPEDRLETECTCPHCEAEFNVKGIEW